MVTATKTRMWAVYYRHGPFGQEKGWKIEAPTEQAAEARCRHLSGKDVFITRIKELTK